MDRALALLSGGVHYTWEIAVHLLVSLYRYGPWWLGCWNYVAREDICAVLTRSA